MIPVHKRETLTELAEAITRAKSVFRFGEDVTIADLLHQCCDTHENQLTQDLATAKGQIEMLKESNENWMEGFKAKERDLADADKDLATAQAEIARLLGHIENIYHYNDECSEPSGYVEFQCDEALSQPSPSLQEYRDMKADAERYRLLSSDGGNWGKTDVNLDKLMENNNSPDFKWFLDKAIDALKGKSC